MEQNENKAVIDQILHRTTLELIKKKVPPEDAALAALDWAIGLAMTTAGNNELGGQMAVERVKQLFSRKLHGRGINDSIN